MSVGDDDLAVDRELAEIAGSVPLLRFTTPINVEAQRGRFMAGATKPDFEYEPLPDLAAVERRLGSVDPDRAGDPVVRQLALKKKRELETHLNLLAARGTNRFFMASVELFGHVEKSTFDLAIDLLGVEPEERPDRVTVSAEELAATARTEINEYRMVYPELAATVFVDDKVAGVRVENGDLYVGRDVRVALDRVEALVNHEVGVHVLTYANGRAQPLHLLAVGLAGYEEVQEALGVLAEHLSGGLTRERLRVLAYRVVAGHLRCEDAAFAETVDRLMALGAAPNLAFTTTMRTYRAGGMTKDALYLRGLQRLLDHLATGGTLERLYIGKVTLEDEPVISELLDREVLKPPPLRPRFLDTAICQRLLDDIRGGFTIRDIGGVAA